MFSSRAKHSEIKTIWIIYWTSGFHICGWVMTTIMRKIRKQRTCPTLCWVVQWRWRDPPQNECYRRSEWLSPRSEGFGFQQLHLPQAPLGSRRRRPFLPLLSSWRCLQYWTGCCCDCSPLHCCWSRWVTLSAAVGYWAWMMGHPLSPDLRREKKKPSHSYFTFIVALDLLDMWKTTFRVQFENSLLIF